MAFSALVAMFYLKTNYLMIFVGLLVGMVDLVETAGLFGRANLGDRA